MSKRTESNFWKTLKSNIEKIDSEVVLTRIENSQTPGIPDLLLMDRNKRLHMIELKVAKGNQVNLSPFQVSFAVRHQGSNCWVLVQRWRPAGHSAGVFVVFSGSGDGCIVEWHEQDEAASTFSVLVGI